MKRYPAGAGCDDDPRRRWDRRRGDVPDWAVVVSTFCRRPQRLFADARRPDSPRRTAESVDLVSCGATTRLPKVGQIGLTSCQLSQSRPKRPELGTEAAEILISPSGGVPAARGEAAATSERSERERVAVRFAVEAVCCGVVGCQRSDGLLRVETPHGPRVLCPAHLRRWGE